MKKFALFFSGTIVLLMVSGLITGQNSILSDGTWVKISTADYGIYKIGYADLQGFGIDPSVINPKNIRMYGNGNGMLPEDPEEFRYDDLQEIAIKVIGENDEIFDPDDYILFFGEGPIAWNYKEDEELFKHHVNLYTDKVCYFLNWDIGPGKRIETQYSTILPHNYISSSYDDYYAHELDLDNLMHSGKNWYGEKFSETLTYSFSIEIPGLQTQDHVRFYAGGAARSTENSKLNFDLNGNTFELNFTPVNWSSTIYARHYFETGIFTINNSTLDLSVSYDYPNDSSAAWLDCFGFNVKRNLSYNQSQMMFRDLASSGSGIITRFEITTNEENHLVWNVTDPLNPSQIDYQSEPGMIYYTLETDSLLEFVVFRSDDYLNADFQGAVENQNLHGITNADMIIVTHPDFMEQANQLAAHHETFDNLDVVVTTTDKIYNEFSSGVQDVSTIRDFVKYVYEKEPTDPVQYLLLFGKASYDYKDRIEDNTNFVPVWESEESLNLVLSYCTDDFFVNLDSDPWIPELSVGRIPAKTPGEASAVIDKIIHYTTSLNTVGSYRNRICFGADDGDGNLHLQQTEQFSTMFDTLQAGWEIEKVYLDAYPIEFLPNGQPLYPEVNQELIDKINDGLLLFQYTGHGGYNGLAHEQILTSVEMEAWNNGEFFPLMTCATGDLNRFDDPEIISIGEQAMLLENSGMIGVLAPVRATYAQANFQLQQRFNMVLNGNPDLCIGKILQTTKENCSSQNNKDKHHLLGDPVIRLAIPLNQVITTTINGIDAGNFQDTIQPGQEVIVTGLITDADGNHLSGYSGDIELKVFDKVSIDSTLGNTPNSYITSFEVQDSVLLIISSNVSGGEFTATFNLPDYTSPEYGYIKFGYYANDNGNDARGEYNGIMAGGQPSSIPDSYSNDFISVFPTVTDGILNFKLDEPAAHLAIDVTDIMGKRVERHAFNNLQPGFTGQLELYGLNRGFYFVKCYTAGNAKCFKILRR